MEDQQNPLLGTTIGGRYQLVECIASGGYSTIYRGIDLELHRDIAVKVLHTHLLAKPANAKRFRAEAEAISRLKHPNISVIFDYGTLPSGQPFLVLEYVAGETLSTRLENSKIFSTSETIDMFRQLCDALGAAHKEGVLHRDVKPSNIMLIDQAPGISVKLLDFGVAKIMSDDGESLTGTGELVGTVSYLSPEQCTGDDLDGRTDVYSLGCTLFECVTGVRAFSGQSALEIVHKHLYQRPVIPQRSQRTVAPDLEAVILKAISKNRYQRYQTMEEFSRDLCKVNVAPAGFGKSLWYAHKRLLMILLVGAIAIGLLQLQSRDQKDFADEPLAAPDQKNPALMFVPIKASKKMTALADAQKWHQAILADPKNAELYYKRGRAFQTLEQYEQALSDYAKAMELNPKDLMPLVQRADIYCGKADYQNADKELAKALKLNSRFAPALAGYAGLYYLRGNYKSGLDFGERAIDADSTWAGGYNDRGANEYALKRYREALADFTRAIALDGTDPSFFGNKAAAYRAIGEQKLSVQELRQGLSVDPGNLELARNAIKGYMALSDWKGAIAICTEGLKYYPSSPEFYQYRAKGRRELYQWKDALSDVNRAIVLNPSWASSYECRFEIFREMHKYDLALVDINRAIALKPAALRYSQRAACLIALGRVQEAYADAERAVNMDKNQCNVYSNIACALQGLGRRKEAIAMATKALSLNPKMISAYINRASVYNDLQQYDKAVVDCQKALKLVINDN